MAFTAAFASTAQCLAIEQFEFAIVEFNVGKKDGYAQWIEEGRRRWRRLHAKAAIRDVIKDDPVEDRRS